MKQILVLSLLIASLGVQAIGQSVDAVTKNPQELADEKTLLQMERDWNEALKTRNVKWFEENLAGDMTEIMSSNGSLQTKADSIKFFNIDKTIYESLEVSDLRVRVEGNAGIVTGVNHIKARDEGGRMVELRFAFTDIYIKREGRWQVWASQHTAIKP
jgi:ketosteroid isomerase-like protein